MIKQAAVKVPLTAHEIDLIMEALRMSASRHESTARYTVGGPRATSRRHDDRAEDMRSLRQRLAQAWRAMS